MIKLPKDAEGREIPLDTECLYTHDGEKQDVFSFTYYREKDRWEIETDMRIVNSIYLYLTPPDSWEKLEEDFLQLTVMGKVYLTAPEKVYLAIADLIDRPMCHDLVEHKQDPFIPGKRMVDGYFHCSNCGWDGRIWEHIGFGDMLAYEPIHCPKCGARIERRA